MVICMRRFAYYNLKVFRLTVRRNLCVDCESACMVWNKHLITSTRNLSHPWLIMVFTKTQADHCAFARNYTKSDFLILLLYVDDMLIVGFSTKRIVSLKNALSKSFAMKDLGPTKKILGVNISCDRKNKKLWLSQDAPKVQHRQG